MNTPQPTHIKVHHDDEFRRFSLSSPTFSSLVTTLRRVLSLSPDVSITVKFLDDEQDWATISSDQDLAYAIELAGSPSLRLSLKMEETKPTTENPKEEIKTERSIPQETEKTTESEVLRKSEESETCFSSENCEPTSFHVHQEFMKMRCRHGERGGRRGRGCRANPLSQQERLETKKNRILSRVSEIGAQLQTSDLKSDRERVLRWKLLKLQDKLELISLKKEFLENSAKPNLAMTPFERKTAHASSAPSSFETKLETETETETEAQKGKAEDEKDEESARCGFYRRGRGHHGHHGHHGRGHHHYHHRHHHGRHHFSHENSHELSHELSHKTDFSNSHNFFLLRSELKAARKFGNREQIEAASLAFKEAKKQLQSQPKFQQLRQRKKNCFAELREARLRGDEEKVRECQRTLAEVSQEIRAAKCC